MLGSALRVSEVFICMGVYVTGVDVAELKFVFDEESLRAGPGACAT
jgi:hypothetical protein